MRRREEGGDECGNEGEGKGRRSHCKGGGETESGAEAYLVVV